MMMTTMKQFLVALIAGLILSSAVECSGVRSLQASSSSSAHASGVSGGRASANQFASTCEGSCVFNAVEERSSTGGLVYSNRLGAATSSGEASTDNTAAAGSSSRPFGTRGFRGNLDVDFVLG